MKTQVRTHGIAALFVLFSPTPPKKSALVHKNIVRLLHGAIIASKSEVSEVSEVVDLLCGSR
jgi:hypothetical protein